MQIKKDIPLFLVLALVFTVLLLSARSTEKPCMGTCMKGIPAGKVVPQPKVVERGGGTSPLNFITRGIFHIPS